MRLLVLTSSANHIRHWLGIVALASILFLSHAPAWADTDTSSASSAADTAAVTTNAPTSFDAALNGLLSMNFDDKKAAVQALPQFNHPNTLAILAALGDGNLFHAGGHFYIQKDNTYFDVNDVEKAVDNVNNAKKITINNAIRQWVKSYVAEHALMSPDTNERRSAITQMLQKGDDTALAQVQAALPKETNAEIKGLLQTYLARADLAGKDVSRHATAIELLSQHASPENLTLLQQYAAKAPTPQLKAAAQKAIAAIDQKLSMMKGVETLSFGLSLGSVLVLTAIGLAITFGVMGVINMAHGELMMIGAYCAYVVQLLMPNHIGASVLVSIPVAFVVSGLVGVLIERFVVRYLYGRPLETLLATFGISLILQQAVRSIFSPLNRMVQTPDWMSGTWQILPGLAITWNRVYIFIFCLLCFFALMAVMKYTRLGLQVRAVSQNRDMARAMGINDRKVDMLTFGLGAGVAGMAGVALSQLTNVGPNLGQQYIVDSFMVVVLGGVGNLWGTLVAGLGLGILNKFMEPWLGAMLAKILVLVFVILFIQKYPRGLFPQKGRAVE
ncbi:urea ABC transporter permease subunit UrtB [Snodgrassella sp. CFCC 13594]|uniref:urea ABC transporter permease subunit UrtB n=1 Tax=Snodgrassella sp. CFCC 13594 TaxID=1775559 RepID=UPI0009ED616C|nr:urea ABC transporter permease subunit UrtB [Snodgrassella sp. CFCC 13594]